MEENDELRLVWWLYSQVKKLKVSRGHSSRLAVSEHGIRSIYSKADTGFQCKPD